MQWYPQYLNEGENLGKEHNSLAMEKKENLLKYEEMNQWNPDKIKCESCCYQFDCVIDNVPQAGAS